MLSSGAPLCFMFLPPHNPRNIVAPAGQVPCLAPGFDARAALHLVSISQKKVPRESISRRQRPCFLIDDDDDLVHPGKIYHTTAANSKHHSLPTIQNLHPRLRQVRKSDRPGRNHTSSRTETKRRRPTRWGKNKKKTSHTARPP